MTNRKVMIQTQNNNFLAVNQYLSHVEIDEFMKKIYNN